MVQFLWRKKTKKDPIFVEKDSLMDMILQKKVDDIDGLIDEHTCVPLLYHEAKKKDYLEVEDQEEIALQIYQESGVRTSPTVKNLDRKQIEVQHGNKCISMLFMIQRF